MRSSAVPLCCSITDLRSSSVYLSIGLLSLPISANVTGTKSYSFSTTRCPFLYKSLLSSPLLALSSSHHFKWFSLFSTCGSVGLSSLLETMEQLNVCLIYVSLSNACLFPLLALSIFLSLMELSYSGLFALIIPFFCLFWPIFLLILAKSLN